MQLSVNATTLLCRDLLIIFAVIDYKDYKLILIINSLAEFNTKLSGMCGVKAACFSSIKAGMRRTN